MGALKGRLGRWGVAGMSAIAIGVGLGSCASRPESTDVSTDASSASESDEAVQIVTTIVPMTQFTQAVAGDRAEVIQLLPANVGPHDYQAKPTDVLAIANADVLVKNGLELEFFLDDLINNADNADLAVIDSSQGISTFATQADDHDHADAHEDEDHDSSEGDVEIEDDAHEHGSADPHVWLDPKRAIEQVENIRDGLIAADPAGEVEYMANAAAYIEQLQALDDDITERLAPYAGKTFIAFHDFAFYFADSYGLKVEYLVDIPEENPAPGDVRRIIETARAENIKALLTEPQAGNNAFDSLSKDLNVGVSAFDPMETGEPAASEPDYYFTIMQNNVDSLEAALGESAQSWEGGAQLLAAVPKRMAQVIPVL
ncbi:MAG: zinc ABC transporter substrate-binding protein [Elainellaceae cyanobacterium]